MNEEEKSRWCSIRMKIEAVQVVYDKEGMSELSEEILAFDKQWRHANSDVNFDIQTDSTSVSLLINPHKTPLWSYEQEGEMKQLSVLIEGMKIVVTLTDNKGTKIKCDAAVGSIILLSGDEGGATVYATNKYRNSPIFAVPTSWKEFIEKFLLLHFYVCELFHQNANLWPTWDAFRVYTHEHPDTIQEILEKKMKLGSVWYHFVSVNSKDTDITHDADIFTIIDRAKRADGDLAVMFCSRNSKIALQDKEDLILLAKDMPFTEDSEKSALMKRYYYLLLPYSIILCWVFLIY
jgi:hypothetical protein